MSAQLQHSDAPAVGTLAEEAPAPQAVSPSAPVAPAAEEPPRRRPGPFLRVHRAVKEIEPWGILFAVVALVLSLVAFWIDYSDRVEERTVRAWQLLTTKAPGNSGKREALEYLNREDGLFCGDDSCLLTLKPRTPLPGIDLSRSDEERGPGVYLIDVRVPGAILFDANLGAAVLYGADLHDANLSGANLGSAKLGRTNLRRANLGGANLRDADLARADLSGARLTGADLGDANLGGTNLRGALLIGARLGGAHVADADLSGAILLDANLSDMDLRGARALVQEQLDFACGNESTKLPEGLTVSKC